MFHMLHHLKRKLRYYFISEVDQRLDDLRRRFPLTQSQKAERAKYQVIAKRRDHASVDDS